MPKKPTHSIRVVAGELRGRRLDYPAEKILRPTMVRAKTSLFDSLGGRIAGGTFVDLYAAAGGMGIEALSRGAELAWFVERDPRALACLERNLEGCGLGPDRARVHAGEVFAFLEGGALAGSTIEVVFADPPYATDDAGRLVALLDESGYDRVRRVIVEHRDPLDTGSLRRLHVETEKRVGDTRFTLFT